ncbi:DNA polymerase domain-containing protein [Bacteriovoracaceae bacterium]|nr:DNA polymerase domain-containing protein [Bacteriovoracaceae bacterium]
MSNLLYGHGNLMGIVSVYATSSGKALVWVKENGKTLDEPIELKFNPFNLCRHKEIVDNLKGVDIIRLGGDLDFKYRLNITNNREYKSSAKALIDKYLPELKSDSKDLHNNPYFYVPNCAEQFLIDTGNTYFKGLEFSDLIRMQIDIETTGLNADAGDRVFMTQIRVVQGNDVIDEKIFHGEDEKELLLNTMKYVEVMNPDVIENHNIYRFDLDFLHKRCNVHGLKLDLGRHGNRDAFTYETRNVSNSRNPEFVRYTFTGREIVDTLHSSQRYKKTDTDLENCKLKYVAKYFGVAAPDRVYIDGAKIYETYKKDPQRVCKYGLDDVREVDEISKILNQDRFRLAQYIPMTYEKLMTTGNVKMVEYPFVMEYLRQGHSIPAPTPKEKYEGAHAKDYKRGIIERCIKLDVASMYPNIIIEEEIKPVNEPLNLFLPRLKLLKDVRLKYKALSKESDEGKVKYGPIQKALKIVINATYGYLGAEHSLFNNVKGAEQVTKQGKKIIKAIESSIESHGGTLVETDTDGVICSIPATITEEEIESLVQADINSKFPGIDVELDEKYAWSKVYVQSTKNYAFINNHGKLKKTGNNFKSKDMPPYLLNYVDQCLIFALDGKVQELVSLIRETYTRVRDSKLTGDEICRVKTTRHNYTDYKGMTRKSPNTPIYESLVNAGNTTFKSGETISFYYRNNNGTKEPITKELYSFDYDIDYYLTDFKKKTARFKYLFDSKTYRNIFTDNTISIDKFSAWYSKDADNIEYILPSALDGFDEIDLIEKTETFLKSNYRIGNMKFDLDIKMMKPSEKDNNSDKQNIVLINLEIIDEYRDDIYELSIEAKTKNNYTPQKDYFKKEKNFIFIIDQIEHEVNSLLEDLETSQLYSMKNNDTIQLENDLLHYLSSTLDSYLETYDYEIWVDYVYHSIVSESENKGNVTIATFGVTLRNEGQDEQLEIELELNKKHNHIVQKYPREDWSKLLQDFHKEFQKVTGIEFDLDDEETGVPNNFDHTNFV